VEQELLTLQEHLSSPLVFICLHDISYVLRRTLQISRQKTMFSSSICFVGCSCFINVFYIYLHILVSNMDCI
jgi:hypothetical protein